MSPRLLLSSILSLAAILPASAAPPAAPAAVPPELAAQINGIDDTRHLERLAAMFAAKDELAAETLAWKRLVELRPHLGRYKLELAAAYARADRKSEAYNALLELQSQGYAYDIGDDPRFAKVATTEVWKYIVQGLDANRAAFGPGTVEWTLPREDLLIESLGWDPTRRALLVGSGRNGTISVVGKDGSLEPLVNADDQNGMWAVTDFVVDARRGAIWVASAAIPHFRGYDPKADLGRAGVFKFDLESGKFLERHLSPPGGNGQNYFLSTLALGASGEVYAGDGINNAVYVVRDGSFRRLFHAPMLTSIRGMTVSGDGRVLYFADHERGVLGFDLGTAKPFDVRVPKNLALGGLEGLAWWDGHLVAVQNDMVPNRVMRLKLSADGRDIVEIGTLAANVPALTRPTDVTVSGDSAYVIANSQKPNYDRFGLLQDKAALEGIRIYRLPVTEAVIPQSSPVTTVR